MLELSLQEQRSNSSSILLVFYLAPHVLTKCAVDQKSASQVGAGFLLLYRPPHRRILHPLHIRVLDHPERVAGLRQCTRWRVGGGPGTVTHEIMLGLQRAVHFLDLQSFDFFFLGARARKLEASTVVVENMRFT